MSEIKVDCIKCGKSFQYFTEDVNYDDDNQGFVKCPNPDCGFTNTVDAGPDDDDEFGQTHTL